MATYEAVMDAHSGGAAWEQGPWLHSKRWDLCFLTLSGVLVLIPLALYELVGSSAIFVNLLVAGLIGGPHMYSTFFRTTLDPSFRQRYRFVVLSSCAIPLLVIAVALWHFQLLITVFFFWASIHVLHQVGYIVECYNRKQVQRLKHWSRFIDYAVVFSCLFPMASYKFIHNEFYIGRTLLLYPDVLKTPIIFYLVAGFFALSLLLFIAKTVVEIRQGTVHYPKLFLILTTVALALLITSYSGRRLEIAFQGFNTWHSFQYLALTWYITVLRRQRDPGDSTVMKWLAKTTDGQRFWSFYGVNFALTVLALAAIGTVVFLTNLGFERSYYIVVLSVLLTHYYHDHVLFTRFDDLLVRSA
jgi:hypothetical protein